MAPNLQNTGSSECDCLIIKNVNDDNNDDDFHRINTSNSGEDGIGRNNKSNAIISVLKELDRRRRNNNNNAISTVQHNDTQQQQQDLDNGSSDTNSNSSKWTSLILGQCVAIIATSMNASSYEVEHGLDKVFPMFLMFFSYVILTLHLYLSNKSLLKQDNNNIDIDSSTLSHLHQQQQQHQQHQRQQDFYGIPFLPILNVRLRMPWYCYVVLSVLDLGPNYLALLAYSKTSYVRATLLQSLTIPSTMIFCKLFLSKQYKIWHFIGVALCMIGGTYTVLTDNNNDSSSTDSSDDAQNSSSSSSFFVGDVLAVLAAIGYGIGDASVEFWSKHVDRKEYLGMIGLFGSIVTFTIAMLFERNDILDLFFANNDDENNNNFIKVVSAIGWYVVSLALYYVFESSFLQRSDATLLNLSLQCQNLWAVLCSVIVFGEIPDTNFYVSMFFVTTGVCVYELFGN